MSDLEEERRLFYVAITRAEKRLFLTYATSRYKFGNVQFGEPSRFLKELPDSILSVHGEQNKTTISKSNFGSTSSISGLGKLVQRQPIATPTSNRAGTSEPFVADDVSGLTTGVEVKHEKFGDGKVLALEGNAINRIATIFFPNFGEKKIMLKFAKLKIIRSI